MSGQKLRQTCWAPVDPKGKIWVNWANTSKSRVIKELNYGFGGWREEGWAVQRFTLVPGSVKET